ncbi:MAG: DNA polymerase IV [Pseudomonadota bacterium]
MSHFETFESAFCPRCETAGRPGRTICEACGKARVIAHPELFQLSIAHLDCDAFYAAIEKRDDPSLEDKPVIIGGGRRGVVSTACYVARTYGVHSAMPMFKALAACPDAVVIKPNMQKYAQAGRAIRQMMLNLTPLVEPLSIDEAFMDLSGTERLHGAPPAVMLTRLQKQIAQEIGVTASVGLSHNKFLAKVASDLDKPRGFSIIGKSETQSFLAGLPITAIWGVGKATARKLEQDGLKTIAQLQATDQATLAKRYGEIGLRLYRLSRGADARSVSPHRETKSVSSETTFHEDISDLSLLEDILWELCEKVSGRMKASGFEGRVITLKLKTADFKTITRRETLETPTNLARLTFSTAKRLLQEAADNRDYRLIGVGFSMLSEDGANPISDLFAENVERIAAQESAIDVIREKFGDDAIGAGRKLRRR